MFRDPGQSVTLTIATTDDPSSPPLSFSLDSTIPDILVVGVSGSFGMNHTPVAADLQLVETASDSRVFEDEMVEAQLTADNRDLPQPGEFFVRDPAEPARRLARHGAHGKRTRHAGLHGCGRRALGSRCGVGRPAPVAGRTLPASYDYWICRVTVPAWSVQESPLLLEEDGVDSPNYANSVEMTATEINEGFGRRRPQACLPW